MTTPTKSFKDLLEDDNGLEVGINLSNILGVDIQLPDLLNIEGTLPSQTSTTTTTTNTSNNKNIYSSDSDDDSDSDSGDDESDLDDDSDSFEEIMKNSVNIAYPNKAPTKPQPNKSLLSKKTSVNVNDKFDFDSFNGLIKKKSSLSSLSSSSKNKKGQEKQMEEEKDTDSEQEENEDDEDDESEDEEEGNKMKIDNKTTTTSNKKKKLSNPSEMRVSKEVRKLLSKGNEQYTNGLMEEAFSTYAEVVRLAPRLYVPYNILAKIKEQAGYIKEALGFYIYSAQIQGTNSELWSTIGHLAKDINQTDTALYCFSRAYRNDQSDLSALYERCLMLSEKGFHKRALKGLTRLNRLRPGDPMVLQEIARVYSILGQYDDATAYMAKVIDEQSLSTIPLEEISLDSVNLMMELKNKNRNFQDTISIFNKIVAKYGNDNEIPPDLLFNACQAYYSIGTDFGNERGSKLLHSRILTIEERVDDLYHSLAEELHSLGKYQEALQLYLRLKGGPFDNPQTWVKTADCYKELKNYQSAIDYFIKANKEVPDNVNTTLAMSEIYREMGDDEKALQILDQSSNFSNKNEMDEKGLYQDCLRELDQKKQAGTLTKDDVKLFYRRAESYLGLLMYSQYLGISTALLNGSNDKLTLKKKVGVGSHKAVRFRLYKKFRKSKSNPATTTPAAAETTTGENTDTTEANATATTPPPPPKLPKTISTINYPYAEILEEESYFNLLLETSKILSHFNRHQEAAQYLRYALKNISFVNGSFPHQLKFLTVAVAFSDKNYYLAFKYVKYVCAKKPYSNRVWNLFNKIIVYYGNRTTAQQRFLTKLYEKYPQSLPVLIMLGNASKQTDNVRGALFEYLKAYKMIPDDPLINLLIAVLILSSVMGRKQANRHKLAITAYSFLHKYLNLRGDCQESFYNLARGYHQLGIYNMAIEYYNKVLEFDDPIDEETGEIDKNHSLKCESAFNLSLIYKSKGNINLANDILKKYIVV